jgi:flavoprotein hydroxylase
MPPFAGQGMCTGVRDVVNLAWKLDLVLSGRAGDALLDTYSAERRAQAKAAVLASVKLGRVICVTDPAAAADRDRAILANGGGRVPQEPPAAAPLTTGLLGPGAGAGEVMVAGRVKSGGVTGRFDDVVGRGLVLLTTEEQDVLDEDNLAFLTGLGGRVVRLAPAGAVRDVDGVYHACLDRLGASTVLIRPDHHVFGSAGPGRATALVDDLRAQLSDVAVPR